MSKNYVDCSFCGECVLESDTGTTDYGVRKLGEKFICSGCRRKICGQLIMENKVEKCENSDACVHVAKFECESCGAKYCNSCAEDSDFECECETPPKLIPIKRR